MLCEKASLVEKGKKAGGGPDQYFCACYLILATVSVFLIKPGTGADPVGLFRILQITIPSINEA